MVDTFLLLTLPVGCLSLVVAFGWTLSRDRTSYLARVLLCGQAIGALWALALLSLILAGDSAWVRALCLPPVSATAVVLFLITRAANVPDWRPPRWFWLLVAVEVIGSSLLGVRSPGHHLLTDQLASSHIGYGVGLGVHLLFTFALLGLAALEMGRRSADRLRWMRRYATSLHVLIMATFVVHVLQIRVTQLLATAALLASTWAVHRYGMGRLDLGFSPHQEAPDPVTGLLSRRDIERVLARAAQEGEGNHVLVIDLDRFKEINDTYGHMAGDAVLAEVAHRIRRAGPRLELGRFGGDEFVAVLSDATESAALHQVGELIAAVTAAPVTLPDGRTTPITVSIGIAACTGGDWRAWVAAADSDMYLHKASAETDAAGANTRLD